MRRSIKELAMFGATGGAVLVGSSLALRQYHLRNSPVVTAAEQQLHAAEAVRGLLGSTVVSTSGVVGGYTDPVGGTACITLPVISEGGIRAVARVEAEAEWLVAQAQAEARGEALPPAPKPENCRWLLRHLEIELEAPSTAVNSDGHALTLYSLPRNAPLSPWAPSRAPSVLPRWLRALLPEPSAVAQAEAAPRLVACGFIVFTAHAVAFSRLHRKMVTEQMLRRAETVLALPDSPIHAALATRAVELAAESAGPDVGQRLVRSAGAPVYGHANSKRVLAFLSLRDDQELFFKAERSAAAARPAASSRGHAKQSRQPPPPPKEEWTLVHIGVAPTDSFSRSLAQLPADAGELALLETMLTVEVRPFPLGPHGRQVVVPQAQPR